MDGSAGHGSRRADMVLPNYKLGKTLGIGSFGKVKIAEHTLTGHKVAIKILNRCKIKSMGMEENGLEEIKILSLFKHPHITRLHEVIVTPTDIYVVMEYVKSGDLFDYIDKKGRLQEEEARNFFQQIISGVEYCHRNMVVHRDLKLENLLLVSKIDVKIADFGLSNIMRDGYFLKTSCGSPNYAAPEVLSGKLYAGPEVDVWSCGVILYVLLCGTYPFVGDNTPDLLKKIKGGMYSLPSHLSPGARDLIPRMLMVDPIKRMTIPEIRQHTWFQGHDCPRCLAVLPPDTIQQAKKEYGFNHTSPNDSAASAVGPGSPGYMDYQGMGSRHQFPVEKKWAPGLQYGAHPREIMTEVLKALQELNACWKKIGHYNMKCRWIPGHHEGMISTMQSNQYLGDEPTIIESEGVNSSPNVVKFEVQLYKTCEEKYLLDLLRVQGPQLLFLDLCAAFLAQLQIK